MTTLHGRDAQDLIDEMARNDAAWDAMTPEERQRREGLMRAVIEERRGRNSAVLVPCDELQKLKARLAQLEALLRSCRPYLRDACDIAADKLLADVDAAVGAKP